MKYSHSLTQSMTVSQRARLRTPLCLAALAAMLFAGAAWGQHPDFPDVNAQPMGVLLVQGNHVPASAEAAYPVGDDTPAPGDDISVATSTEDTRPIRERVILGDGPEDPEGSTVSSPGNPANGEVALDNELSTLAGAGRRAYGVVDWVLVQIRIVDDGAPMPIASAKRIITKAGFLLSDGTIADPSADPTGGVLTFEDVDYDPDTEDLYVAIRHRNHLRALSQNPVGAANDEGEYEYSFLDVANIQNGVAVTGTRGSLLGLLAGDSDGDGSVVAGADADNLARPLSGGAAGYRGADSDMNGSVVAGADADNIIAPRSGRSSQFTF